MTRGSQLMLAVALVASFLAGLHAASAPAALTGGPRQQVLVLDLDGTIYDDECEIEQQIRVNYRSWALSSYNITTEECTALRVKYGSTVRGMAAKYGGDRKMFAEYYNTVYPTLDMSLLHKYNSQRTPGSTGYSMYLSGMQSAHKALYDIKHCPIVVASNSPVFHVKRVLSRVGLADLPVAAFVTPERTAGVMKTESAYWDNLFKLYPKDQYQCTLVDDNKENVALVRSLGMTALRIESGRTFTECIVEFLLGLGEGRMAGYKFDENDYLAAKNAVDAQSFNREVFRTLQAAVQRRVAMKHAMLGPEPASDGAEAHTADLLQVLDLGAGHLNMLSRVLELVQGANKGASSLPVRRLRYVAVEGNANVLSGAVKALRKLGLVPVDDPTAAEGVQWFAGRVQGVAVRVALCQADYMGEGAVQLLQGLLLSPATAPAASGRGTGSTTQWGLDLVVGACMADLHAPGALLSRVVEIAGDAGGLLYLPITFDGRTALRVADPTSVAHRKGGWFSSPSLVPSAGEMPEKALYPQAMQGALPELLQLDGSPLPRSCSSNDVVFGAYHQHLQSLGHHLSSAELVRALGRHGCRLLTAPGASDWRISKKQHPYLWSTMLHFLTQSTCFPLFHKYQYREWLHALLESVEKSDVHFVASNVDILAELPVISRQLHFPLCEDAAFVGVQDIGGPVDYTFRQYSLEEFRQQPPYHDAVMEPEQGAVAGVGALSTASEDTATGAPLPLATHRHCVEFTAPGDLRVVREEVPALQEGELRIRTACTLVSTGTELKVFSGDIASEGAEPLDLTIQGMSTAAPQYPMKYGYSLVGTVEAVGAGVDESLWLGKRVFSFSPHSTVAIAQASSVLPIPDDVCFEDAAFLPSVETAVSLVMSANPMLGERVAVVGQGLIGQLTAAVLKAFAPTADLSVLDISDQRLQAARDLIEELPAAAVGSVPFLRTANPLAQRAEEGFDVCIEVSGSMAGLQTAVDSCMDGGRVIIGSWYSTAASRLSLGTKFHRSGVQLIASQVSRIPARLSDCWTKERRFDVAWDMLRRVRPSRMLGSGASTASLLERAELLATYRALSKGQLLTALLDNDSK